MQLGDAVEQQECRWGSAKSIFPLNFRWLHCMFINEGKSYFFQTGEETAALSKAK